MYYISKVMDRAIEEDLGQEIMDYVTESKKLDCAEFFKNSDVVNKLEAEGNKDYKLGFTDAVLLHQKGVEQERKGFIEGFLIVGTGIGFVIGLNILVKKIKKCIKVRKEKTQNVEKIETEKA